jgi:hypothetical protein
MDINQEILKTKTRIWQQITQMGADLCFVSALQAAPADGQPRA